MNRVEWTGTTTKVAAPITLTALLHKGNIPMHIKSVGKSDISTKKAKQQNSWAFPALPMLLPIGFKTA